MGTNKLVFIPSVVTPLEQHGIARVPHIDFAEKTHPDQDQGQLLLADLDDETRDIRQHDFAYLYAGKRNQVCD